VQPANGDACVLGVEGPTGKSEESSKEAELLAALDEEKLFGTVAARDRETDG
jgi:hypothetical protein